MKVLSGSGKSPEQPVGKINRKGKKKSAGRFLRFMEGKACDDSGSCSVPFSVTGPDSAVTAIAGRSCSGLVLEKFGKIVNIAELQNLRDFLYL